MGIGIILTITIIAETPPIPWPITGLIISMALDRQIVHQQEHLIALLPGHPIVRQLAHLIALLPGHPIVRQLAHRIELPRQIFLPEDQGVPGVVEVIVEVEEHREVEVAEEDSQLGFFNPLQRKTVKQKTFSPNRCENKFYFFY